MLTKNHFKNPSLRFSLLLIKITRPFQRYPIAVLTNISPLQNTITVLLRHSRLIYSRITRYHGYEQDFLILLLRYDTHNAEEAKITVVLYNNSLLTEHESR